MPLASIEAVDAWSHSRRFAVAIPIPLWTIIRMTFEVNARDVVVVSTRTPKDQANNLPLTLNIAERASDLRLENVVDQRRLAVTFAHPHTARPSPPAIALARALAKSAPIFLEARLSATAALPGFTRFNVDTLRL